MTTAATPEKPAPGTTPITTPETPPLSPIQKAVADAKKAVADEQNRRRSDPQQEQPEQPEKPETEQPEQPEQPETEQPEQPEQPEGEEAPATEDMVVEIRGRRPGDPPIKLALDDKETADLVRAAVKDGLRRDELSRERDAIARDRDDLEVLHQHLEVDPIGFILERVRPELHVGLARHLLSTPEVFEALRDELMDVDDENVRARRTAELRSERAQTQREAELTMRRMANSRDQVNMIRRTIDAITPPEMADDEAGLFRDDALADMSAAVRAHYDRHGSDPRLRPEDVLGILERRLRHYGIDPELARAALSSGQPPRRASAARRSTAPAPGTTDEDAARTTGAKLKQASANRREAAAVPGAGAGARPSKVEIPAQQGVKERIAFVRKLVGI